MSQGRSGIHKTGFGADDREVGGEGMFGDSGVIGSEEDGLGVIGDICVGQHEEKREEATDNHSAGAEWKRRGGREW